MKSEHLEHVCGRTDTPYAERTARIKMTNIACPFYCITPHKDRRLILTQCDITELSCVCTEFSVRFTANCSHNSLVLRRLRRQQAVCLPYRDNRTLLSRHDLSSFINKCIKTERFVNA
jgi:hypothetical protein